MEHITERLCKLLIVFAEDTKLIYYRFAVVTTILVIIIGRKWLLVRFYKETYNSWCLPCFVFVYYIIIQSYFIILIPEGSLLVINDDYNTCLIVLKRRHLQVA